MTKLSLPPKADTPEVIAIRKDLILALIPVASRHALSNPQQVVDIATKLCDYVVTGRKPLDTSLDTSGPA
jgi:hypothetical protein